MHLCLVGLTLLNFMLMKILLIPSGSSDDSFELEESLVLCDTGIDHHSGNIHEDQKETMSLESVERW